MNKNLLFLIISLAFSLASKAQTYNFDGEDDIPLTKSEMRALWKQLKKVDPYERNSLTYDLTTTQTIQMKEWLKKYKSTRTVGTWLMVASPFILAGSGALGRALTDERYASGKKKTPAWSATVGTVGFLGGLIGGAILYGKGNKRYNTSHYLIVDTPIRRDFQYRDFAASTGLQIINDQNSNALGLGTGITITF